MSRCLHVEERPARGLITGHTLIARGMKPGPAFRPILDRAIAAQDSGEFDEATATAWLDELLGGA